MSQASIRNANVAGATLGIGKATAQALRVVGGRAFGASRKPAPNAGTGHGMPTCGVADDAPVAESTEAMFREARRIDPLVDDAGFGIGAAAGESWVVQARAMFDVDPFGVVP